MHGEVKQGTKDGKAEFGEFPWVAFISFSPRGNANQERTCSGVVINNRVVVTSA